jgi:hypothetical protein
MYDLLFGNRNFDLMRHLASASRLALSFTTSARSPEAPADAPPQTEVRAMKKIDWSYHRKG